MKEGKGMTEKWKQHISLGFLAISFLLFAVSVLCYANETVQFYFIGVDAARNQGNVWQCGWPLILFTIFYLCCWRYHPQYKSGDPVRFFRYEWAIMVTEHNASIINRALKRSIDSINGLVQFCGVYYYLQLYLQNPLPTGWILPAAIIFILVIMGIFCHQMVKAKHEI